MRALWMTSGIVVWAVHFAILYGFTGLACARGYGQAVPWVAGGATLAAIAAMGLIALRTLPRRGEFMSWMTLAIAGLGAVAVLYEAVSLFVLSPCA
jgi:hypothetical protein